MIEAALGNFWTVELFRVLWGGGNMTLYAGQNPQNCTLWRLNFIVNT